MALQLDVITPERRLLSEQADSVTVPGRGGELGILPGHTPLISELQTGVLSYTQGPTTRRLLVSGGFVEVNDDRVSVLADLAEFPEEVDAARARARAQSARRPSDGSALSRARPKSWQTFAPNSTAPTRAFNSPRATPHADAPPSVNVSWRVSRPPKRLPPSQATNTVQCAP
ncbi:MAG: ATP synthase F1 subunit epsilon [Acidobacteria bacterium]|nr:MAG: ATP synthase F1 subunit epsilon [Acidobacteriota bacterium]